MSQGESLELAGYTVEYDEVASWDDQGAGVNYTRAVVDVYRRTANISASSTRALTFYFDSQQTMTIPGLRCTLQDDLYILLVDWQPVSAVGATFKIYLNPLVNWLWIGSLLFLVGYDSSQPGRIRPRLRPARSRKRSDANQRQPIDRSGHETTYSGSRLLVLVLSGTLVFAGRLAVARFPRRVRTPQMIRSTPSPSTCSARSVRTRPWTSAPPRPAKNGVKRSAPMLADGKSEAEIKQHFVDYYGARVLSEPPRTGFNWLVYVVPPIVIVAGVFVLFRAFGPGARPSETGKPARTKKRCALHADDEYIARMEEELKKRK